MCRAKSKRLYADRCSKANTEATDDDDWGFLSEPAFWWEDARKRWPRGATKIDLSSSAGNVKPSFKEIFLRGKMHLLGEVGSQF